MWRNCLGLLGFTANPEVNRQTDDASKKTADALSQNELAHDPCNSSVATDANWDRRTGIPRKKLGGQPTAYAAK